MLSRGKAPHFLWTVTSAIATDKLADGVTLADRVHSAMLASEQGLTFSLRNQRYEGMNDSYLRTLTSSEKAYLGFSFEEMNSNSTRDTAN